MKVSGGGTTNVACGVDTVCTVRRVATTGTLRLRHTRFFTSRPLPCLRYELHETVRRVPVACGFNVGRTGTAGGLVTVTTPTKRVGGVADVWALDGPTDTPSRTTVSVADAERSRLRMRFPI